jgi:sulfite dehydrogenase
LPAIILTIDRHNAYHVTTLLEKCGGQGIREVAYSVDAGKTWREAGLGNDLGRYSFREFTFAFTPDKGTYDLRVRAWNRSGQSQPMDALWQPAGYMRNVVERVSVAAV